MGCVHRTAPAHQLTQDRQIGGGGGSTIELLLPEHCCCYGSKPGCIWGAFWLFSTSKKQAGADFFFKKQQIGPQLNYRCQSTTAAMEENLGGLGALLADLDGCNSSWAVKINFCKKNGDTSKTRVLGSFFYPVF